jgi:hypothetical protein
LIAVVLRFGYAILDEHTHNIKWSRWQSNVLKGGSDTKLLLQRVHLEHVVLC